MYLINKLEKHLSFLALPNLALYLIVLQVFGFVVVSMDPSTYAQIVLSPDPVLHGEWWRVLTWLGIPRSQGLWMLLFLYMIWWVVGALESEWGAYRTTMYLLVSALAVVLYSFATGFIVTEANTLHLSFFLAMATLFPETELLLIVFPVKAKWLGWISAAFFLFEFILISDWITRGYQLAAFAGYIVFFYPLLFSYIKRKLRRNPFRS